MNIRYPIYEGVYRILTDEWLTNLLHIGYTTFSIRLFSKVYSLIRKANPPFRPAGNLQEERVRRLLRLLHCPLRLPRLPAFRY